MKTKHKVLLIIILLLTIGLVIYTYPAQADAAPPSPPPGYILEPGEELTMVQMVSELVVIEVGGKGEISALPDISRDSTPYEGYEAHVTATFWMENKGEEDEALAVRFPSITSDGYDNYYRIKNLIVKVNGVKTPWWEDTEPSSDFSSTYFAHFDVEFPVGEEVVIEVTYTTIGYNSRGNDSIGFRYVLGTGAGWFGPIGSGDIIFRLPYAGSPANVSLGYPSHHKVKFLGNEVLWHFENLEPEGMDNWDAWIVSPDFWTLILNAQKDLEENPNDLDALFSLGKNILYIYYNDRPECVTSSSEHVWNLFITGEAALDRAVSIAPDDVDIVALYAKYLRAFVNSFYCLDGEQIPDFVSPPSKEKIHYVFDLLESLDPDLEKSVRFPYIDDSIYEYTPTATLTPSPTPTPSGPSPTPTIQGFEITAIYKTATAEHSAEKTAAFINSTPTPERTALSNSNNTGISPFLIGGSIFFILIAFGAGVFVGGRRKQ